MRGQHVGHGTTKPRNPLHCDITVITEGRYSRESFYCHIQRHKHCFKYVLTSRWCRDKFSGFQCIRVAGLGIGDDYHLQQAASDDRPTLLVALPGSTSEDTEDEW